MTATTLQPKTTLRPDRPAVEVGRIPEPAPPVAGQPAEDLPAAARGLKGAEHSLVQLLCPVRRQHAMRAAGHWINGSVYDPLAPPCADWIANRVSDVGGRTDKCHA